MRTHLGLSGHRRTPICRHLQAASACEFLTGGRSVRVVIYPDDEHPCPVCGADWKVPQRLATQAKAAFPSSQTVSMFVPENSGWCSDPECRISDEQRDEYREFRRIMGCDPTEESVARPPPSNGSRQ